MEGPTEFLSSNSFFLSFSFSCVGWEKLTSMTGEEIRIIVAITVINIASSCGFGRYVVT